MSDCCASANLYKNKIFIYGGRFWNKGWDIGSFDLESNIPEKNILKGELP